MQRIWVWVWIGVFAAACGKGDSKVAPKDASRAKLAVEDGDAGADSPYDYRTWTKKLDDPRESERAVTELEQLGHPEAIPALGEAWLEQGRPVRILQVIISLARPLTSEEAKAKFVTDYEESGRKASWDDAMPFLQKAIDEVDEANPRSVDSATKAADALGEAGPAKGIATLEGLANRPSSKMLIASQIAAIRALGKFASDKPRAAGVLIKLVERQPPAHPRTAAPADRRASEEKFAMHLATTGAAVNSLAELRVTAAAKPLLLAMYRTPELTQQIRRALVASGPTAKAEVRKVLQDSHAEVNKLFADHDLDQSCAAPGDCQPVSAKDFYAAIVLGDFHDPATADDLLLALRRPPAPAYYYDGQPGPTQVNAIADALRKIGAPTAAEPVRAMWMDRKAPLEVRIAAIGAYPFLAGDSASTAALGAIAADNTADDGLRVEAATAFARLSRNKGDMALLDKLAKRYLDAAASQGGKTTKKDLAKIAAADKRLDAEKQKLEAVKAKLLATAKDPSATVAQIKKQTAAAKKAEEAYKAARRKHRESVAPYKQATNAAKAYKGYARMFQAHIARIEVAMRCTDDAACYAQTLSLTPADAANNVASHIKDIAAWTAEEKLELVRASVDRAMLELGKLRDRAAAHHVELLEHVKSDDRTIRQSILLALPKITPLPCGACDAKLEAAIKSGEGKPALETLDLDTKLLRTYFASATP